MAAVIRDVEDISEESPGGCRFNTWLLFEETVVDRYGLWEYMPYYRVAKLCAWDIGALALIIWITFRVLRRPRRTAASV